MDPQFNVYPSVITFLNILYCWSKRDGDFFAKIKILGPKRKLREDFTGKQNIWSEMALEKEGEIKEQFYKKEFMWSESGKDQKEANEQKGDN